jgi:cytochrome c oxidase cbb3-type subunit IV
MKFIHYLEKISGVSIYGLSSFALFGLCFLIMLFWAWKADKAMIDEISRIPLDSNA